MTKKDAGIGAAILGFYAAIKISVRRGYNPEDVYAVVKAFLDENPEHYDPSHDKIKRE